MISRKKAIPSIKENSTAFILSFVWRVSFCEV